MPKKNPYKCILSLILFFFPKPVSHRVTGQRLGTLNAASGNAYTSQINKALVLVTVSMMTPAFTLECSSFWGRPHESYLKVDKKCKKDTHCWHQTVDNAPRTRHQTTTAVRKARSPGAFLPWKTRRKRGRGWRRTFSVGWPSQRSPRHACGSKSGCGWGDGGVIRATRAEEPCSPRWRSGWAKRAARGEGYAGAAASRATTPRWR